MTEEQLREIKQRSLLARPTSLDVSNLINEIQRLKKIILKQICHEDDLGYEFTYVVTLKEEIKRLTESCDRAWELNGERL